MDNSCYLKITINNLEHWFDGFVSALQIFDCVNSSSVHSQIVILYDMQIREILEQAKNLIKEIKDGDSNET